MQNKDKLDKVAQTTPSLNNERMEHIKQLFPECFPEGKLDFPKFREALGHAEEEEGAERYHFTWAGKRDAIQLLQTPTRATLVPCQEESVDFETTGNIYVEGDNLEVLKLLYKPYFGRVKAIYIDPPYNTGGDFVYPDNYADPLHSYLELTGQKDRDGNRLTDNIEKTGRYHSTWLTMMYPRLFLARQLLQDDGIIFVSIDDHEVHNLRLLMNEVFGEENILQQIVWQRHAGGANDAKYFALDHEYVLAYAKNKDSIAKLRLPLSNEQKAKYTGRDEWYSTLGPYKSRPYSLMRSAPRPGLQYDIELPDGTKMFDQWKWEESRFLEAKNKNQIIFRQDSRGNWRIEHKSYLNTSERVPRSLLTNVERNSQGRAQLREMFREDDVFNNPKPVGFLKHLLQFSTEQDSLIVDFFAGSSTTAEAILEMNQEDGGNRRFLLVQLPEPTPEDSNARKLGYETISDIGKERIRRVIAKMRDGNLFRDSGDLGVRVFKLTNSNYRLWNGIEDDGHEPYAEQMRLFSENPLIDGWLPEDVIYEVAVKEGYRLDCAIEPVVSIEKNTIFRVVSADKQLSFYICLDDELFQDELNKLELTTEHLFVCRDKALDDTKAANLALQCRVKTI